jgi:hypothetical protein
VHFAYLKDRLFLACFLAYWAHRFLAAFGLSTPFLRSYLNDLICIPFWVPIMVWTARRLGWRRHDGVPNAMEVLIPLLLFAIIFEILAPNCWWYHIPTIADPLDVLAYTFGALAAVAFWRTDYDIDPIEQKSP